MHNALDATGEPVETGAAHSDRPGVETVSLPERLRRASAPGVALLACSLGLCCFVSLAYAVSDLGVLVAVNDRFIGWVGAASMLSLVTATGVMSLSARIGTGPALTLGVIAAVLGLTLAADLASGAHLALSLMLLGGGSGALLAGSICMATELPRPLARLALLAWSLPVAGSWPVIAWFSRHSSALDEAAVTVHPSWWLVSAAAATIALWSILNMLVDPHRLSPATSAPWQDAWSVLALACSLALLMVMLLGFDSGIGATWLRPVVLVTSGLVAAGWGWTARLVPGAKARLSFVGVVVPATTLPSLPQLLVVAADAGEKRVGWEWLLILTAFAIAGGGLGWRIGATQTIPYGLVVYALASAGAWIMPGQPWLMTCVAVPLVAAGAAVLVASLHGCSESRAGLCFVGFAVIAAIHLGSVFSLPFTWSVSGDLAQLSTSVDEVRAMGRVLFGLTFSASVLAAAYTWILSRRTRSLLRR